MDRHAFCDSAPALADKAPRTMDFVSIIGKNAIYCSVVFLLFLNPTIIPVTTLTRLLTVPSVIFFFNTVHFGVVHAARSCAVLVSFAAELKSVCLSWRVRM